MKKTLFYVLMVSAACVAITSCNSKDKKDPYSAPFAKESIDAGKSSLSDAGQGMIDQINLMKDVDGASALESFVDCNSKSDPAMLKNAKAFSTFFVTESVISDKKSFSSLLGSLATSGDDPQTFQEFYNSYKGVYTWDAENEQWTKTTDETQLTFIFPKTKGSSTNDAKLVITYHGISGTSVIPDYSGDLPTLFDIAVSVNNTKISEYSFTASYNSDGVPTSVESFIALYPFKIGVSWGYSSSEVSVKYYFKNDAKIIVEFGGGVGGRFDKKTLDTAENVESVLYNANAYFQILNVKLAGRINYKALAADSRQAEKLGVDSLVMKAQVAAINKDAALVLVYTDTNKKIAQAEAYLVKDEYYDWVSYSTDIRFVFTDGSKGDMKSYFSNGFTDLVNSFNDLVTNLQDKFAPVNE